MRKCLSALLALLVVAQPLLAQYAQSGGYTQSGSFHVVSVGGVDVSIYADPAGSDSNNCLSLGTACKTIARVQTVLEAQAPSTTPLNIVVYFRGGTYPVPATWTLTATDGGYDPNHVVLWSAYNNESVTFSGGVDLTGFTACTSNAATGGDCPNIPAISGGSGSTAYQIYRKPLASATYGNFESIYYNGERRVSPYTLSTDFRYQTFDTSIMCATTSSSNASTVGACPGTSGQNYQFTDRLSRDAADTGTSFHDLLLGDVQTVIFEKWTSSRMRLAVSTPGPSGVNPCTTSATTLCYVGNTQVPGAYGSYGPQFGHRYVIANVREGLTAKKLFYLDRCPVTANCASPDTTMNLYYAADVAAGENPATDTITIPQDSHILDGNGVKNFGFSGINIYYSNYLVPSTGVQGQAHSINVPASISWTNTSNIMLDHFAVGHTQDWGMEFIGTNGTGAASGYRITNALFLDTGSGSFRDGLGPTSGDTASNLPQFGVGKNALFLGAQRFFPSGIGSFWFGQTHDNQWLNIEAHKTYSGFIGMGDCLNSPCTSGTNYNYNNEIGFVLATDINQYMTSDFGFLHAISSNGTGNSLHDFIAKDIYEDLDAQGYGGHCIYIDGETTHFSVYNGLCVRMSGSATLNNDGSDNHLTNLIFAHFGGNRLVGFGLKSGVDRGKDLPAQQPYPDYLQNNIFLYGLGNVNKGTMSRASTDTWCTYGNSATRQLAWDYNDWWDTDPAQPLTANANAFILNVWNAGTSTCSTAYNAYSFNPYGGSASTWQTSQGEDLHSLSENPQFIDPYYDSGAGDNYNFTVAAIADPGAAYKKLGFTPINYAAIGLSNPSAIPAHPATVPDTFPAPYSIDKNTGWGNH